MHRYRRLLVFPVLLGVMLTLASFRLNTPSASAGQQNGLVSQNCSEVTVTVTICTDTIAQTFSAGTTISIAFQGGSPGVTVTCNTPSGITCTVGGGNNGATLVCQVTCQSGSSFVVVLPGGATQYFTMGGPGAPSVAYSAAPVTTSYVNSTPVGAVTVGSGTPQVNVTVQTNGCPSGGYTVVVTVTCSGYGYGNGGGQCVLNSYLTNYGCTGASIIAAPYTYSYAPLYVYGGLGYGSSCGYGYVSSCGGYGYSSMGYGGCSVFVFSCGSGGYGYNNYSFNNNCGGVFGGFGSWGCNGFGGGFSGHNFGGYGGGFGGGFNCNTMTSAACYFRQGGVGACTAPFMFKYSGTTMQWGCFP